MRLILLRMFWLTLGALIAWVAQEVNYAPVLPDITMHDKEDDE